MGNFMIYLASGEWEVGGEMFAVFSGLRNGSKDEEVCSFEEFEIKDCPNCGNTGECETELYEGLTTCWVCQET